MSDLLGTLQQTLGPRTIADLGRQIGADSATTERAVGASLPLLIGGLARNTADPQGAASLDRALERDHDGSVLDQLGSLLGGGAQGGGGLGGLLGGAAGSFLGGQQGGAKALDGAGILGHIFGGRRDRVETGVGRASGLDSRQVGQLLVLLAPLVMGALGKVKRNRQLDSDGLRSMLGEERREVESRVSTRGKGSLLDLLDRDDDGSGLDDVGELVAGQGGRGGILGNLLR
jgi:hypothetical protein